MSTSNHTFSSQTIQDLFITACEGGVNYWCDINDYDYKNTTATYDITTPDAPDSITMQGTITDKTIVAGIKALQDMDSAFSRRILNDIINEDFDAETCDVVLQLGIFGDIIFG